MAPVIAAIAGYGAKMLADRVLMWIAIKALLLTLFILVLPVVLKNFFIWILEFINEIIMSKISDTDLQASMIQLTGLAGYMGNLMKLPQCFNVILSAVAVRITLNFIPFIR